MICEGKSKTYPMMALCPVPVSLWNNMVNFFHVFLLVTTIRPQLGVISFDDDRRITIADLPGLIEGAHMNVGMGHFFLKHLERTKVLLLVVDVDGFQLKIGSKFRDAFETVVLLNKVSSLSLYLISHFLHNCCFPYNQRVLFSHCMSLASGPQTIINI